MLIIKTNTRTVKRLGEGKELGRWCNQEDLPAEVPLNRILKMGTSHLAKDGLSSKGLGDDFQTETTISPDGAWWAHRRSEPGRLIGMLVSGLGSECCCWLSSEFGLLVA